MQIQLKNATMESLTKPSPSQINRKSIQFNLRLSPDLMDKVRKLGEEYERPANYVINHAIKQLLIQHGINE